MLDELFRNSNAIDPKGRYNNILAKILIHQAYETEFCLYDHHIEHPLQDHLYTEKKSIKQGSFWLKALENYRNFRIQKYFGLNFLEFFNLPADRYDDMINMSLEWINEENTAREKEERNADKENRALDQTVESLSFGDDIMNNY